ncbi:hypothetical protein BD626DRAFT_405443 [Schizophyllum amplum]|uniref:Uncharacterized protein n=1 Tax=Schizophyllum amplum TaxID=97359 RepID=A0A550C9Y0_9AGAR|nr:hypothetical protein BD626DRAFT_405443 [Auriculariopsis ampla]
MPSRKDNDVNIVGATTDTTDARAQQAATTGDRSSPASERKLRRTDTVALQLGETTQTMKKSTSAVSFSRLVTSSSSFWRRSKTVAGGSAADDKDSLISPQSGVPPSPSSSSRSSDSASERPTHTEAYYMTEALVNLAAGEDFVDGLADVDASDVVERVLMEMTPGTDELACVLVLIWREARESNVNRVEGFYLVRSCAEFLDNLKAEMALLDKKDIEEMADTIRSVLRLYLEIHAFFDNENDRWFIGRIIDDESRAKKMETYMDNLLQAGSWIGSVVSMICLRHVKEIKAPVGHRTISTSISMPNLDFQAVDSALEDSISRPMEHLENAKDDRTSFSPAATETLMSSHPLSPGMSTSASTPGRSRPQPPVLGHQRVITYRGAPAEQPKPMDAQAIADVRTKNAAKAWEGIVNPVRVRYPSITPAQYERVKATMRAEYGELELQSQITHMRFFMLGATRLIGYKLVQYMDEEGSHIPRALRVLEMTS